ncbi:MAG TPA: hypothetical protein VL100_04260 [Croceibacterium sp.]|nr:hypothetical protein [Croceibacterium sp.]
MNGPAILLASLALVLPAGVGNGAPAKDVWHAGAGPTSSRNEPSFANLLQRYEPEVRNQVRIEQRVIIRVAPARRVRQDLIANLPPGTKVTMHYRERPMKRCVEMANIAGVQSGPENRLILFMRDRHIVSAALEKACSARDFYSGFYVERSEDGLLCSGRDTLQSRTGASCGVRRLAHLVALKE